MTKFKTIITAAIAALALTTASLAIPGQAFAAVTVTAGMAATATATGSATVILATVFLGMVITTIAVSSLTTAAGNGAPTAR